MTLGDRRGVEILAFDGVRPGVEMEAPGGGFGGGDISLARPTAAVAILMGLGRTVDPPA